MEIDKVRYPWAEHMSPDDRIGAVCTYEPMQYLPLFEENFFETGNDRIGTLRYFVYDPTKHGYPSDRKYPLLFALHGAWGGMQDRVAIDWAGVACYASPEYQEKLGGMYIVCPLANESVDTEGRLQMAWPTSDDPGTLEIYSEKQRKTIEKALVDEPHRMIRLGTDSIYSDSLRALLKKVQADYLTVDPAKIVLFGTSAGGYMAWRLLINHPEDYALGCVMAGAYLPAECELRKVADAGTRVLVCHARYDELVHWPLFIEPNLELYKELPNIETYFPEFARNGAKEIIDCPGRSGQQGQHCVNNCIQQNLIYDDGTLFDERFPEGMTGYINSILEKA